MMLFKSERKVKAVSKSEETKPINFQVEFMIERSPQLCYDTKDDDDDGDDDDQDEDDDYDDESGEDDDVSSEEWD